MTQDYQVILERIHREIEPWRTAGRVADYIPELAQVPASRHSFFDPEYFEAVVCTMAFRLLGDELWERVGREPSGTLFHSLVQLEAERGKPRNPFINAGALVVT